MIEVVFCVECLIAHKGRMVFRKTDRLPFRPLVGDRISLCECCGDTALIENGFYWDHVNGQWNVTTEYWHYDSKEEAISHWANLGFEVSRDLAE